MSTPSRRSEPADPSTYWTVLNPAEQTADWGAFYANADLRTAATREELPCELDIPYGDHPRQMIDLYLPQDVVAPAPVFVFIHGGGFREGDRAHYGFVADSFAAHGIVTVVPGYRLMPEASYFDAVEDVRTALVWVAANIGDYGGHASGVRIGGHSAGAILAAFVGADTTWLAHRSLAPDFVRGFAAISAAYDFTTNELPSYARGRFADDDERHRASPVLNVRDPAARAVVALGSREEKYVRPSHAFAELLRRKGVDVEHVVLEGEGHDGTVLRLADSRGELFRATLGLLRE
jgi:arylformamidase